MVVCRECGNAADSADGFCSSCGALLEWSGQPVAGAVTGGQALAARQPAPERARPGPVPLVTEPAHAGPYCTACGVRNPEGRTFCRSCGRMLRPGAGTDEPAPGWWRRLMARLRGRQSYVARGRPRGFVSDDAPLRQAAGFPAASSGKPPRQAAAIPGMRSPHPPSPPGSFRPPSTPTAAGRRIRRASQSRRMLLSRFAPVILVAGMLGIGIGPARGWLTAHVLGVEHRAQAQLSAQYVNVVPVRAKASSAAPGHGAMLAIDGIQQTYWLTGGGNGTGARLRIRFAGPQDIDRVGLLSGEPGGSYTTQARARTIELIAAGNPPVVLSFQDTSGFQNRPVSLHGVTVITAVITSAYPGQQGQAVAVRELEFFTKS